MAQRSENTPDELRKLIADIPDFPLPGIVFRDISPLLRHHFTPTLEAMIGLVPNWDSVDAVAGIEARGFILAAGIAALKGKGFVKVRKKGKLPGKVLSRDYGLEYGTASLEMQPGNGRLLIVDDVLATGGTLEAAAELAAACGYEVQGFLALINLAFLNQFAWHGMHAQTLITYDQP